MGHDPYHLEPTAKNAERRAARHALSLEIEKILRLHAEKKRPAPAPPLPFPHKEPKDGPARFRSASEPIGRRWDTLPFGASAQNPVAMKPGQALWLRVMPLHDPGRKWASHELEKHALRTGMWNLIPFHDYNPCRLRAGDGMGYCSIMPDAGETGSLAYAFEIGEVWSIDTDLLSGGTTIPFLEKLYAERLANYARFLSAIGAQPPYRWIAGITGVLDRYLEVPPGPGEMRVVGARGPTCLVDTIIEEGVYDGKQSTTNALLPFFRAIFDKCGLPRPRYLPGES